MLRISATVDDVDLADKETWVKHVVKSHGHGWTLTALSVRNRPFVLREYETRATVRGDIIQKVTNEGV